MEYISTKKICIYIRQTSAFSDNKILFIIRLEAIHLMKLLRDTMNYLENYYVIEISYIITLISPNVISKILKTH